MSEEYRMKPIAHIHTVFPEKFGIPRQSGLVDAQAAITFEPAFAAEEALRGLDGFSHLWLLWCFSAHADALWHATVRPPRLGGNTRVGVFASRSPFRPNPIGLSCVRLEEIRRGSGTGPVLVVRGADMLDGTPILDIKPYLRYADAYPEATGGFSDVHTDYCLDVQIPEEIRLRLDAEEQNTLYAILRQDPRPSYQNDPDRLYGLRFGIWNVTFRVQGKTVFVNSLEQV